MVIQEPFQGAAPAAPPQDLKAAYDRMTTEEAHKGFARNLNAATDESLTPEESAAAWDAVKEFSEHTNWMWASPDLFQVKSRWETAIDFARRRVQRPALEEAYNQGKKVTVDDAMWWPAALGKTEPLPLDLSSDPVVQEVMEAIRAAPQGTQYLFEMRGDKRVLSQLLPDGATGFVTDREEFTQNPFADQRPGEAAAYAPQTGSEQVSGAARKTLAGIASTFPWVRGGVDRKDAAYRGWLHQMGIRPTFGVGANVFDSDGRMSEAITDDDPESGLIDVFTGGEAGIFIEPELRDRVWTLDDPRVHDNLSYMYGDVAEEDGQPFVKREAFTDQEGNEHPEERLELYPIGPQGDVVVTMPNGEEQRLTYDQVMGEASNAIAGGKLGVGNIAGHFYYGEDQLVETPLGRFLVPKITGNPLTDKELMRDPKFLRSILYADEKYGSAWLTRTSQEIVGLAEFVGSVKLGKLALAGVGKAAAPLAKAAAASERGGLVALAGRTVGAFGRAVSPSAAGPAVKSVFTFNPSMVGAMVWHETFRGAITGEGSADEWIRHGVAGGISFWAFGAATSIIGRGLGMVGRGVAGVEAKLGKGRLAGLMARYQEAQSTARAFRGIDQKLRAMSPEMRALESRVGRMVEREFQKPFLAKLDMRAAKHVTHAMSVGAMMGSFSDAHYLAARAGEPELDWWDPAFLDYWGQAWASGHWTSSAVAFAGVTAAEYGWNRRGMGKKLLSDQDREALRHLSEHTLRELDMLAQDPAAMRGIFQVLGDPALTTESAVARWIRERLGAAELALDVDAPDLQAATIEHLGELAQTRSGPALIEEMLSMVAPARLLQWEEQALGVRTGGEIDVKAMRGMRSVLGQIKAERERRAAGGAEPERPKRARKPRPRPEEIPEEEWADHFAPIEQAFFAGKSRERHRLIASRLAIVQAKDPGTGEFAYVVVDSRQRPKEDADFELYIDRDYPFTPEGLRQAMGDTLARAGKRKAERALIQALKKRKGDEGPPDARGAVDPRRKIVASEEAEELLAELEEAEGLRETQRGEAVQKAIERITKEQATPPELVYHGSNKPVLDLRISDGLGVHVGTERAAEDRLRNRAAEGEDVSKGRVLSYQHEIRHVIELEGEPVGWTPWSLGEQLVRLGELDADWLEDLTRQDLPRDKAMGRIREELMRRGIDALAYRNKVEDEGSTSFVVLDPKLLRIVRGQGKARDLQPHLREVSPAKEGRKEKPEETRRDKERAELALSAFESVNGLPAAEILLRFSAGLDGLARRAGLSRDGSPEEIAGRLAEWALNFPKSKDFRLGVEREAEQAALSPLEILHLDDSALLLSAADRPAGSMGVSDRQRRIEKRAIEIERPRIREELRRRGLRPGKKPAPLDRDSRAGLLDEVRRDIQASPFSSTEEWVSHSRPELLKRLADVLGVPVDQVTSAIAPKRKEKPEDLTDVVFSGTRTDQPLDPAKGDPASTAGGGTYFTTDPQTASAVAGDPAGTPVEGSNVRGARLDMRGAKRFKSQEAFEKWKRKRKLSGKAIGEAAPGGIIIEHTDGHKTYVVFDASRIRPEVPFAKGETRRVGDAHPEPIGPERPPVPERPETIKAQMAAMLAGRKPAVLITPGEAMPKVPAGYRASAVPRGTLITEKGNDLAVAQAGSDQTLHLALGYGGRQAPTNRVVTARDSEGTVVADIQSPPTWRVLKAARGLAGPGGTVEQRGVPDALAEREGRASPLTLAPPPPGSRLPTADELIAARRDVAEALEGRRGFGGLTGDERASRYLRPRDVVSIEALGARVDEARANPPPLLVPPSAAAPSKPAPSSTPVELDAALLDAEGRAVQTPAEGARRQQALAEALRTAREAAAATERLEAARAEQEDPGDRSSLWSGPLGEHSTRSAQFRIGAEFFTGEAADRHVAVFATVQSRLLRDRYRAELAATESPESRAELARLVELETQRMDSIVAGMLVATGVTPPPSSSAEGGKKVNRPGFQPTIAKLTGYTQAEVEVVRQRMIDEGRRWDPLIEEYLAGAVDKQGRRLISPQQLHRKTAQGHQPTFDLLRVVALAPPADLRLRRGHLFQGGRKEGGLFRAFEKWVELEEAARGPDGELVIDPETDAAVRYPSPRKQLEEVLLARGVGPAAAAKAAGQALDGRLGRLGGVRGGRKTLTDAGGQIVAKVAWSLLGRHRVDSRTTAPTLEGEPTLEEVALGIIEGISGRPATPKERGTRMRSLEMVGPRATERAAARADEVRHADPSSAVELYLEAGKDTAELLLELSGLRMPGAGGDLVLPRGTSGEATFEAGDMRVTNLLHRLAQGDPALLELVRNSMEPDGSPTWGDPDAHFRQMAARAERIQAAQQHLLVTLAKERYGPESAEQVRAVLDALDWTSRGDPVPDHLTRAVGRSTELFPSGALDSRGVGVDAFMGELLTRELYDWIGKQGVALDLPQNVSQVVPFFAGLHPAMLGFGPYMGEWRPVRVESFSLGRLLGHHVDRDGLADWVAQGRGPFGNSDGTPTRLGRVASTFLARLWTPMARQLRSRSLPRDVRASNWARVQHLTRAESTMNAFFEQAQRWRDQASRIRMTTDEANVIGKILGGGSFRRIQSKADWVKLFGEHRPELYDLLADMAAAFNRLGQWMVETGRIDAEAARNLFDSYFPRMWREATRPAKRGQLERAIEGLDQIATGSARERARDGHDVAAETANIIYDARIAFPVAVWQEASSARVWQSLSDVAHDPAAMLSREAYEALPQTARAWWHKATEPFGGLLADRKGLYTKGEQASADFEALREARRRATVEQTRLHDFLHLDEKRARQQERETGRPMPARRREVIDKLREGYFTKATQLEIDLMLDQADPSLDVGGVSAAVQRATVAWRRLKTIQNPKHWMLNMTSSVLTNHIADKVSIFDFLRSVTTGKGLYAEAARDLMSWHDWVRAGRPELDPAHQRTLGILRADRIGKLIGGGTLVRTAFGNFGARDMFDTMFQPSIEDSLGGGARRTDAVRDQVMGGESTKSLLVRAVEAVVGRRGRSQAEHDQRVGYLFGLPDPRKHADAQGELNEVYYLHEMLFKYAAALHGVRHRGLSEADAASWGAEGSGDYRDRSVWLHRMSTNFSAGISRGTRRGLKRLGRDPELPIRTRLMRMGLGSPFWMYRASMYPTMARAMVDRPIRTAATYAVMGMLVQAIDELTGGDRRELVEAQSGRDSYLRSNLTPDALIEWKKRQRDLPMPMFGGGSLPPWMRATVGNFIDSWRDIGSGPSFSQMTGPSGEVLDVGTLLFPTFAEVTNSARSVRDIFQPRPPGDIDQVSDAGIGFLPAAVLAGSMNIWEGLFGREGQSTRETRMKVFSRMAREFFSATGPMPMFSAVGQRGLLALEGRTLTDIARGTPGPDLSLGQRAGSFGLSMVMPSRRIGTQSVQPRQISAGEAALRRLGIRPNVFTSMSPAGRTEREGAIIDRGVRSMIRRQVVNSYMEFIDLGNVLPAQVIFNRRLELAPDLRGFAGKRELAAVAQTEPGRFIKRLVADEKLRGRAATRYEHLLSQYADPLQNLLVSAAARRNMHPSVFERMADGIMRGHDSRAATLRFLWEVTVDPKRPEWAAEHDGEWVHVWDDARMWKGEWEPGSNNATDFAEVEHWVERNRSAGDSRSEILAPQIYDAPGGLGLKRMGKRLDVAPPDIFRMLEKQR